MRLLVLIVSILLTTSPALATDEIFLETFNPAGYDHSWTETTVPTSSLNPDAPTVNPEFAPQYMSTLLQNSGEFEEAIDPGWTKKRWQFNFFYIATSFSMGAGESATLIKLSDGALTRLGISMVNTAGTYTLRASDYGLNVDFHTLSIGESIWITLERRDHTNGNWAHTVLKVNKEIVYDSYDSVFVTCAPISNLSFGHFDSASTTALVIGVWDNLEIRMGRSNNVKRIGARIHR